MIQKYTYKRLTWIDLESPTSDEVAKVMNEYKLHPLVAEELLQKSLKPKVDFYTDYIYLILHIPMHKKDQEIDFVIGKDFIITTKYDTVEPLHNFSKMFEVNSILDKSGIGEHAGFIFYHMLKRLYKNMSHELEHVRTRLLDVEKNIFRGEEKKMVTELSNISRELIDFRQSTRMHRDVLEDFANISLGFFGESFKTYAEDMQSEFLKVHDSIINNKELVTDLRETNDSLLSTKQNETMKTLTIMAFVTFPLSLITDIFSMHTTHAPILGSLYDFEIILGIMALASLIMFSVFRYKKWL